MIYYGSLRVCRQTGRQASTHAHTHVYTYIHTYIHAHTRLYNIYTHIYIYVHKYIHTCTHTHIYRHIRVHTYIHAHTRLCTHIYKHIHIYIYIHTCVYIYIHTYMHYHSEFRLHVWRLVYFWDYFLTLMSHKRVSACQGLQIHRFLLVKEKRIGETVSLLSLQEKQRIGRYVNRVHSSRQFFRCVPDAACSIQTTSHIAFYLYAFFMVDLSCAYKDRNQGRWG
jgi:hypothetical protein